MADHDKFGSVDALHHVENLSSVGDRVNRKKQQDKNNGQRRKQRQGIDDQLEEQLAQDEEAESNDNGHIDFHA